MPSSDLNREAIFKTCDDSLFRTGRIPTYEAIRTALGGGGSNATIARYKSEWEGSLAERIADQRCNHQHQLTARAVAGAQVIAIEDLAVKGMSRGMGRRAFRRSVNDAGLGEIRRQLTYRAAKPRPRRTTREDQGRRREG